MRLRARVLAYAVKSLRTSLVGGFSRMRGNGMTAPSGKSRATGFIVSMRMSAKAKRNARSDRRKSSMTSARTAVTLLAVGQLERGILRETCSDRTPAAAHPVTASSHLEACFTNHFC